MRSFDNCALFVGVNDYRAFDRSTDEAPGTSDLLGSRNDVAWFYRVCRELGIGPENIRVLASPRLSPEELPGMDAGSIREATEAEILDGVAWLADRIGGDEPLPGLFTYSGHGDWKEGSGLVICPSDTTGYGLDHAIPLAKIQEMFADRRALDSLTVVLDCCHSGAARGARKALSLTGRRVPPALVVGLASRGERVLSAAGAAGTSYQGRFAGEHHGGFSWALTSAMDQWTARAEGGCVELTASYGDLLERAKGLLATLGFEQTPVLRGPKGVEETPVFHRGRGGAKEETAAAPDRTRRGGQLDPDLRYSLALSTVSQPWDISVSADSASPALPSNTEMWQVDEGFVEAMARATPGDKLTFTATGAYTAPSTPPPVQMPADSLWTPTSTPAGDLFLGPNSDGYVVGLVSQLTAGATWGGALTWYVAVQRGDPPEYLVGEGGLTLAYGPASAYGDWQWYAMSLPPLSWGAKYRENVNTHGGCALAEQGGTAYCGWVEPGQVWLYVLPADPSAVGGMYAVAAAGAAGVPGLASMNEGLYLAYETTAQDILVGAVDGWRFAGLGSVAGATSPALGVGVDAASSASVLCLAYVKAGGSSVKVTAWSGSSWSEPSQAVTGATGAPALAGFRGELFLACVGASGATIEIHRASSVSAGGTSWSGAPVAVIQIDDRVNTATYDPGADAPASPLAFSTVSLAAVNEALYLSFTDGGGGVWICASPDGRVWGGFAEVSNQESWITSGPNAPIAPLGTSAGKLVLACWSAGGLSFVNAG